MRKVEIRIIKQQKKHDSSLVFRQCKRIIMVNYYYIERVNYVNYNDIQDYK